MKPELSALLIIFFLVALLSFEGIAQDQIILTNGDTINCTIKKATEKYLYYSQKFEGVSANGKILKSNIRELRYNNPQIEQHEPSAMPPVQGVNETASRKEEIKEKPHFTERFRCEGLGGFSYLLGDTENAEQSMQSQGVSAEDAKKYYNDLKTGYVVKASLSYQISKDLWLGAYYHGFNTSTDMLTSIKIDDIYYYYGKLGERNFVNFAGASFASLNRFGGRSQYGVRSLIAIGPVFYRNEVEILNQQALIKGTNLGTDLTVGLEYFIKPQWSICLNTMLFLATINKVTVETSQATQEVILEKENRENLSRFDISIGMVFYW
jgi:hypothetical protein